VLSVVVTSCVRRRAWRVFGQRGRNLVPRPVRGFFAGGMLVDDSPCFYGGGFVLNVPVVYVGLISLLERCITLRK
jgi:hypothetical protein